MLPLLTSACPSWPRPSYSQPLCHLPLWLLPSPSVTPPGELGWALSMAQVSGNGYLSMCYISHSIVQINHPLYNQTSSSHSRRGKPQLHLYCPKISSGSWFMICIKNWISIILGASEQTNEQPEWKQIHVSQPSERNRLPSCSDWGWGSKEWGQSKGEGARRPHQKPGQPGKGDGVTSGIKCTKISLLAAWPWIRLQHWLGFRFS